MRDDAKRASGQTTGRTLMLQRSPLDHKAACGGGTAPKARSLSPIPSVGLWPSDRGRKNLWPLLIYAFRFSLFRFFPLAFFFKIAYDTCDRLAFDVLLPSVCKMNSSQKHLKSIRKGWPIMHCIRLFSAAITLLSSLLAAPPLLAAWHSLPAGKPYITSLIPDYLVERTAPHAR
jgi:hypothetical protein